MSAFEAQLFSEIDKLRVQLLNNIDIIAENQRGVEEISQ